MWNIILIITFVIGGCYLVFMIIKNLLADRKKANEGRLSKKVVEEMAKKIVQDARMHRQARDVDDESQAEE